MTETPYPLQVPDVRPSPSLYVHKTQDIHISSSIIDKGIWEPYETRLILGFLEPGGIFVDVGANIGYYSILAAKLVGESGQVYAFEPEADNFKVLCANCTHNNADNVDAVHGALGRNTTRGELHLNLENRGDHQIYANEPGRQVQPIKILSGDEYLSPRVDIIDVLKIDTQGAELQVLEGLRSLVTRSLPKLKIIVEFCPYSLKKAGDSGEQLLDFLCDLGLELSIIDHIGHALIPADRESLLEWIRQTESQPDNQGFINLLAGS